MSDHDACLEAIDAYALGTLDEAERENVRRHLGACPSCRGEYDELRNVFDVLPHALPADAPSAASRSNLLARLDLPATADAVSAAGSTTGIASEAAPQPLRRHVSWTNALAAALALALLGDGWLAWRLQALGTPAVALAQPSATPTHATPTHATIPTHASLTHVVPAHGTLAHGAPPDRVVAHRPEPGAIDGSPKPLATLLSPSAESSTSLAEAELMARIARLETALAEDRRQLGASDARAARDAAQIARLTTALARKPAVVAAAPTATPSPVSQPNPGASSPPALVAALGSGRVYGVDGVVGSEPWHLTIVQPPNGANAIIYSAVPHAPAGETYRTWVLRGGKTFDAGELRAGSLAVLDMPMPLQNGDVVAFSREPVDTGSVPTTPFLMHVTIE